MIKYIHEAIAKKREALGKDEKGFTLIELLVVVLILGILAAIAIPVFIGQQNEASNSAAKANLANAKVAMIAWAVDPAHAQPTAATAPTLLGQYGWPTGEPVVTVVSVSGFAGSAAAFCLSSPGATGTTWYVTQSAAVSTTACS